MFFRLQTFWILLLIPENTVKSENALEILLEGFIAVKKTLLALRRFNVDHLHGDELLKFLFSVPSYGYEPYWNEYRDPFRPKVNHTLLLQNNGLCIEECPTEFSIRRWICAVSAKGSAHKTFISVCEFNKANCPETEWYIAYLAPCDESEIPWDMTRVNISDRAKEYGEDWMILHGWTRPSTTTTAPTTRRKRWWMFG